MNRSLLLATRALLGLWWVAMLLGNHWPDFNMAQVARTRNDILPFGMDKWVHMLAYAGLAFLALSSFLFKIPLKKRVFFITLALVIYAAINEATQAFSPQRTVQFSDWVASSTGVLLGVVAWLLARWIFIHDGSFVAQGRLVSLLTLISRVFGLLRDWALAFVFGVSGTMDAFVIAFMVPNLFRRLFGEGALSAAFIPVYADLDRKAPATARLMRRRVLLRLGMGLGGLTFLAVTALLAARQLIPMSERAALTVDLTQWMLWYAPLVCCAALAGAALQVHGRFDAPSAAPIILNVVIIAACFAAPWGDEGPVPASYLYRVAWAVLGAGVLQLLWHLAALPPAPAAGEPADPALLRESWSGLMKQWLPTILGLAVFQINTLMDALIAMLFSAPEGQTGWFGTSIPAPLREGDVAVLGFAQRLYEFPLGVFGIALATAIFPALAKASDDRAKFSDLLRQGLRLSLFIGLPASLGLLLVRGPLSRAIYFPNGALVDEDSLRIAAVLAGYAPAIWAYSMNHLLTRAFYAQKDPRTPVRLLMVLVVFNLIGNLILIWPFGVAGLAISTAISAMLQTVLLLRAIRRHAPEPVDPAVLKSWGRVIFLSALMTALVWALMEYLPWQHAKRLSTLAILVIASGAGAGLFLIGAQLWKLEELRWLVRGSEGK